MDKRLPLFFSAFCSLMVGSSVMRTSVGFSAAGVASGAAERIQNVVFQASASGFTPAKIETVAEPAGSGVKFVEAKYQADATTKDAQIVATADAVEAKGDAATLKTALLADLNISAGTAAEVDVKMVSSLDAGPAGRDITREAIVVTAGKRYVLFSRATGSTKYIVAVDEAGTVVGARQLLPEPATGLVPGASKIIVTKDKEYWSKRLADSEAAVSTN